MFARRENQQHAKIAPCCIRPCASRMTRPCGGWARRDPRNHARCRSASRAFVDDVRDGDWKGATGKPMRHMVNIGIGGSDLGPRLAVRALDAFRFGPEGAFRRQCRCFRSAVQLSKHLDPAETLVRRGIQDLHDAGNAAQRAHGAALAGRASLAKRRSPSISSRVSTNAGRSSKFGIDADKCFPMWDWVGGRYSLWSAVGLSVALAHRHGKFRDDAGWRCRNGSRISGRAVRAKHAGDAGVARRLEHGISSVRARMPFCLTANACANCRAISSSLRWKATASCVTRDRRSRRLRDRARDVRRMRHRRPAQFPPMAASGQRRRAGRFHRRGHRRYAPAEPIIGRCWPIWRRKWAPWPSGSPAASSPQAPIPAAGPRTSLLLDRLDPRCFGMLLALYEHKVFVQGVLWDLNSFDQPGVELGKRVAQDLEIRGQSAMIRPAAWSRASTPNNDRPLTS